MSTTGMLGGQFPWSGITMFTEVILVLNVHGKRFNKPALSAEARMYIKVRFT